MGLFQGYSIGANALRNLQVAQNTLADDIANANDPNHARRSVQFTEAPPSLVIDGKNVLQLANGLGTVRVMRMHDQVLDASFLQAQSQQGYLQNFSENLRIIETTLIQDGTSVIASSINQFFNAWSYLASNPSQFSSRLGVQAAGIKLTQTVQNSYSQLQNQLNILNQQVSQTITNINGLASDILTLNTAILKTKASGADASALIDQKDRKLQDLSELMGFQTIENVPDASWLLSGQLALVTGTTTVLSTTGYNATNQTVTDGTTNYTITAGKLLGLFQSIASIQNMQNNLNTLANTFKTQVNTIHMAGINPLGGTNVQFFNDVPSGTPQTGAADFSVNSTIVANPNAIASGTSGNPGDGGSALELSTLRSQTLRTLGNYSFSDYTNNFISSLGEQVSIQKAALNTQEAVLNQIQNQKESISGVSLEESTMQLIRNQRSLQAVAEFLRRIDQTTNYIINGLGGQI